MVDVVKQTLWGHFGASIDMFSNAISMCTDQLWRDERKFYYISFHTAIFLDYYSSQPISSFESALPYVLVQENDLPKEAIDDVLPQRNYSRQDILAHIANLKNRCKLFISTADETQLKEKWIKSNEYRFTWSLPTNGN